MNMDIPFKVTFYRNKENGEDFINFTTAIDEAIKNIEHYSFTSKELNDLRVKFQSPSNDSLFYIEFMDMFSEQAFTVEESNGFLSSPDIRGLYLNIESSFNLDKLMYNNLLPGSYKIEVHHENEIYYAFLNIKPSRITVEQLDLMREEIENTLVGLSREVVSKKNATTLENKSYDKDIMKKYNLILNKSNEIISNIKIIEKEPRFNIIKSYGYKVMGKPIKSDLQTIKNHHTSKKDKNFVKSFNYVFQYNIQVNRALKAILINLLKDIDSILEYLEENIRILNDELSIQRHYKTPSDDLQKRDSTLQENIKKFKQIQSAIILFLQEEWLKEVSPDLSQQDKLPRTPYYGSLYKLHLELNKNLLLISNPLEYYSYYWKETPKLYEVWGFIKLIELIKSTPFNFNDIDGWIFSINENDLLPFLAPETKITLKNEVGLKLVLYYDAFITKDVEKDASFDNPLYTIQNHCRPDFRLDIYYEDYYKGSIIADFKYRALDKLGTEKVYINNNYNNPGYKVYSQLVDYSHARSFFLNRKDISKNSDVAIKRVFGIFPRMGNEPITFIKDAHAGIIRCSVSPGVPFNQLRDEIIEIINDVID